MQAFKLEVLALQISIVLIVLSIGMSASWEEATFLFRNPWLLLRSILSRNVIIPVAAVAMLKTIPFHPAIAITIAVLAATPIPPIMPKSLLKAGGRHCYVFGLLVSQAVLAIVIIPLTVRLMAAAFRGQARFGAMAVMMLVLRTILLPFAGGMALGYFFGTKKREIGRMAGLTGTVLLICAAIPILIFAWNALKVLYGEGVVAGLTVLVIIGLTAGHLLGGPDENDRTVLALATASAHPGVAIAIASSNFPAQARLVAGSVVIYLILRALLVIPYTKWRLRPSAHGGDIRAPARA